VRLHVDCGLLFDVRTYEEGWQLLLPAKHIGGSLFEWVRGSRVTVIDDPFPAMVLTRPPERRDNDTLFRVCGDKLPLGVIRTPSPPVDNI